LNRLKKYFILINKADATATVGGITNRISSKITSAGKKIYPNNKKLMAGSETAKNNQAKNFSATGACIRAIRYISNQPDRSDGNEIIKEKRNTKKPVMNKSKNFPLWMENNSNIIGGWSKLAIHQVMNTCNNIK
jgi:hypothetical protein